MCQCPESGWNHFYQITKNKTKKEDYGVNALNRAGIISTIEDVQDLVIHAIMCQCPESGWNHFYGTLWEALQIKGS